jgi:hypothetical protein
MVEFVPKLNMFQSFKSGLPFRHTMRFPNVCQGFKNYLIDFLSFLN